MKQKQWKLNASSSFLMLKNWLAELLSDQCSSFVDRRATASLTKDTLRFDKILIRRLLNNVLNSHSFLD